MTGKESLRRAAPVTHQRIPPFLRDALASGGVRRARDRFRRITQGSEADRIGEQGFTLVELLVVLGIVGMLATLMAPKVLGYFSTAKAQTAQIQAKNISAALELYYLNVGSYPTKEQGLQALLSQPDGAAGWHGPYLKNESGLTDPWHKRYAYRVPGRNGEFDVYPQGHENDVASSHTARSADDPG